MFFLNPKGAIGQLNRKAKQKLIRIAKRSQIKIDTRDLLYISRQNKLVLLSKIEGFESIDPIDYSKGVQFGFAYISIPELQPEVPPDYYLIRTNVDTVQLGKFVGKVDLLSRDGTYVSSLTSTYTVSSLEVPDSSQGRVILRLNSKVFPDSEAPEDDDDICIGIRWECDNGSEICLGFVIDPTPIDPPPPS
ncbi:MAG: hypothetical protein AAFQ63_22445 [Cyanobacteria bacterium J06621_11]